MHKPVLLKEVLEIFDPQPGQTFVDATINGGGHALAILEKVGPRGQVLGIDWDCDLLEKLTIEQTGNKRLILKCTNYTKIKEITDECNLKSVQGILFDLGFSTQHIKNSQRGFSFLKNEPLDMRYNYQENEITAKKIINEWPKTTIEIILRKYGEERFAHRIAEAIVRSRHTQEISTTTELVKVITRSFPTGYLKRRIHPATKTFQALRIAVNNELDNIQKVLTPAIESLSPGGKIIVISFHSLEDRIVKSIFKERVQRGDLRIINKKVIRPSRQELIYNLQARSAKLRAAQKT